MIASKNLPALMTNVAFACELYMKSLLFGKGIDCRDKHDLYTLYEKLPLDLQEEIRQSPTNRNMSKAEFELTLKENGKAFVIFRYLYERTSMVSDPMFLAAIMDRARIMCMEAKTKQNADMELSVTNTKKDEATYGDHK